MKWTPIVSLFFFVPVALADTNTTISFRSHGKERQAHTITSVAKVVPTETITVWEPHEDKEVTYRAYPLVPLLDSIYGKDWRKEDELVITCIDGFQPSLPVERLLTHRGLLAFERQGDPEFTVVKLREGKVRVTMGPLYLIWDNLKDKSLRELDLLNWPYQMATLDFVSFADRFPKMAPKPGAGAQVKRGFVAFRTHCFACHAVNGEGGTKALDLLTPVSPLEYWKEPWLRKWILNPSALRPKTEMPALMAEGKAADKLVTDLFAYLKHKIQQRGPAKP